MKKDVFISHSSSDFEFASRLCEIFEENKLSCWIAPRDIPYGKVWSEQITEGIENSRVMIFIFTENSNKSKEVLNEINMALQNGITIVPIRLSKEPYNKALRYFLSLHQWIDINSDDAEAAILLLAERVGAFLKGEDVFEKITDEEGIDVEVNVDDELDAKFSRIFDEDSDENAPVSDFKKRLLDRISKKYAEQMFIRSEDDEEKVTDVEDGDSVYFSVAEADCTTMAFIVRRQIDAETLVESYYSEELESEREALPDGRTKVEFSVDYFDREGNPLILITFPKDKTMALIDKSFLDRSKVYLSNTPEVKEFVSLYNKEEGVLKRYRANENARTILIDPTTCCVVPRQRYFDRKLKEWVYYVEIVPDKRYFAFKITSEDSRKKADKFNVAYGYYKGRYGLKRNVVEAAALFDEIGTKEAYTYLAQIFKEDPLLKNEEDYLYYLNKSKE